MSDVQSKNYSELDKLRSIILGAENKTVEELKERVSSLDRRSQDVAEILPDALGRIEKEEQKEALGRALSEPLEKAVKLSIKKDPKTFSDLLYPVILPAIRRAVSEMLRSFIERIDRTVSQRFSLKSLKWRIESARTGIPFSEILLRNTIIYSVEQAMLIHRETGLLIQHSYTEGAKHTDSDAVSAMLMAIQSFVQDSFVENDEMLQRVTIGDHMVYLVDGPYAILACVVHGLPPASFVDDMREILESMHALEPDSLKNFSGNKSDLNILKPLLDKCLQVEYKEQGTEDSQKYKGMIKMAAWSLAMIVLLTMGFLLFNKLQRDKVEDYVAELNQQPGIKVLNYYKSEGQWQLEGLMDPDAIIRKPQEQSIFLDPEKIQINLSAFQGMDDSLVMSRARDTLNISGSLKSTLENKVLSVNGNAPAHWYLNAKNLKTLPIGVNALDLTEVKLEPDEVMAFLDQVLESPETVSARIVDNKIKYAGIASLDWIKSLNKLAENFLGKVSFDSSSLVSHEQRRLVTLLNTLNAESIKFLDATNIQSRSETVLPQVAIIILEIDRLSSLLNRAYQIRIIGETDADGDEETNLSLRLRRAESIKQKLKLYGVPVGQIISEADKPDSNRNDNQPGQRQVRFEASLQ